MTALLRADWLRYRRRIDLWVIAIAVVVFCTIGFLSGYRNDATDPAWQTEAEIRQMVIDTSFFEGVPQEEIDLQINQMIADYVASQENDKAQWEASQAINLQKYGLAQAPFTVLGFGILPLIALFFAATLIVGDEFRHGTIRTSLLAASHRRRFLVARLITIAVMTVALFVLVLVLGLVLSLILTLVGAEVPRSTVTIDLAAGLGLIGAEMLAVSAIVALGVALAFVLRSGALPLVLVLVYAGAELFVANLRVFAPGEPLAGVPQVFLIQSVQRLVSTLAHDSRALAFGQGDIPPTDGLWPLWTAAVILVAWLAIFLVAADRRIRSMDIVE